MLVKDPVYQEHAVERARCSKDVAPRGRRKIPQGAVRDAIARRERGPGEDRYAAHRRRAVRFLSTMAMMISKKPTSRMM